MNPSSLSQKIFLHDHWQLTHTEPAVDPLSVGDTADWRSANVPGNVQTSPFGLPLLQLYQGEQIQTLRWMEKKQWIYRRKLRVPAISAGQSVQLKFHGLDYAYRIFVNRQLATQGQGMFHDVLLDLHEHAGREIEVLIAFAVPPVHIDDYLETTKAQFTRGWDFGPALGTVGIWNDVTLEIQPALRIEDVFIVTRLDNTQRAHVTVRGKFSQRISQGFATVELCGSVRHVPLFDADELCVPLEVEHPQLWWPVGLGEPALHDLKITLDVPGHATELSVTRVGLREVSRVAAPGQRPTDIPLQLVINGVPVFIMGVNWVPPEVCTGEIRDASYEKFLPQYSRGGVNLLRVWGGGLTEKSAFYDRCDELGLMVLQEYPIACGLGRSDAWLAQLGREALAIAKKMRMHPSVVILSGGNENYHYWEMLDSENEKIREVGEQVRKTVGHNHPWNRQWIAGGRKRYDEPCHLILGGISAREAPGTLYQNTSAMEGEGEVHGIWTWDPKIGDHRYRMFDSCYAYWLAADQTLYSEASVSCIANLDSIRFILGEKFSDAIPASDDATWKLHHGLSAAWDNYEHLWFDRPGTEKVFGPIDKLSDAVILNQYLQGEGARFMIEELRRKQPRCSGVIWWGVNEPWPSLAGNSLIDYFGKPKIGWNFFSNAMKPSILSLRYDAIQPRKVRGELWISCNDPRGFSGEFAVSVVRSDGEHDEYAGRCDVKYGQSQPLKKLLPVLIEPGTNVMIHCILRDDEQKIAHENSYCFGAMRQWVLDRFASNKPAIK